MTDLVDVYERLVEAQGATTTLDLGEVRACDFRRFAYAVGDINPRYFDEPVAEAPPIFLTAVMGWEAGPLESDLRADGSVPTATAGLPLEGLRLMGAGQELEFHRPAVDGQRVTMDLSIEAVSLKKGKSGDLIVLTLLRRYHDSAGNALVTCHENLIAR